MDLSSVRREEIKNEVARLYRNCRVILVHMRAMELAGRLGIMVYPYSWLRDKALGLSLKCSPFGYNLNRYGQDIIYYNDCLDSYDIEISIFHEIGHIVLGHLEPSPLAEAEAEYFAEYAMNYNSNIIKLRLHVAMTAFNKSTKKDLVSSR